MDGTRDMGYWLEVRRFGILNILYTLLCRRFIGIPLFQGAVSSRGEGTGDVSKTLIVPS